MRKLWILLAAMAAACGAEYSAVHRQQLADAPAWVQVADAQHAARQAACPSTPAGCFASPPTCVVSWCFCPTVCDPGMSRGRTWRHSAAECVCDL